MGISRLWITLGIAAVLACAGCGDAPSIAGGWLLVCDPEVDWELCGDTWDVGWYFPADGGPLLDFHREEDGSFSCSPSPIYDRSTWVEAEDGSVVIDDVTGVGQMVLERHGELLDGAGDGFVYTYGREELMTKVAGPGACD